MQESSNVGLKLSVDRTLVPASGGERYLLVTILAPEMPRTGGRKSLNLGLVVDRSGSMTGEKLEKAKEAAAHCVRTLSGQDRVAVVAYDNEVNVVAENTRLTTEGRDGLLRKIARIESRGNTNLSGGWLCGAEQVAAHMDEDDYINRVILFSDGLANEGITDVTELGTHANELRRRGVSTTTMGIGIDFDENLMEHLAIRGGGHFYFIEHARQIPDFLARELGETLSTAARRVTLELTLPHGIRGELLNSFECEREGKTLSVRLDDLLSAEERTVVFRLKVREGEVGEQLGLRAVLHYEGAVSGRSGRADETLTLSYASERACRDERPDEKVMESAARLTVAHARMQALQYDTAGMYAQSAATLSAVADLALEMAPASPAMQAEIAELKEEAAKAKEGLTARARKAMHYAHSATRQSRKR
jgi:Ca-activated chloride channel family protein